MTCCGAIDHIQSIPDLALPGIGVVYAAECSAAPIGVAAISI
jgi:hypothetical protein